MPLLLRAFVYARRVLAIFMWIYGVMRVKGWFPWLLFTVLALYLVSKIHESRAKNIFATALFSVAFIFILIASRSVKEPQKLDEFAKIWIQSCEEQQQDPLIQSLHHFTDKQTCEDVWLAMKKSSRLYMNKSSLTSIELLKPFNHIRVIDLSYNQIQDIGVFQNFQQLQELNVSMNPIQTVDHLPLSLVDLNVASTHLTSVKSLARLEKLRSLDISYTRVLDLSPLEELSHLNRLHIEGVQLFDNKDFDESLCPLGQNALGFQCKRLMESVR